MRQLKKGCRMKYKSYEDIKPNNVSIGNMLYGIALVVF